MLHKQPALFKRSGVLLLHNNARPHTIKATRDVMKTLGWKILPHPSYSPDVHPSNYYLFSAMDDNLREEQFRNPDEVTKDQKQVLNAKKRFFSKMAFISMCLVGNMQLKPIVGILKNKISVYIFCGSFLCLMETTRTFLVTLNKTSS